MTDADENTPSEEHGRIAFQPDYDKYGLQPLDDGTLILRIDQNKHLFEQVGTIRHEEAGVVLERYVEGDSLDSDGSFERIGSVSPEADDFESRLRNGILHLIYEGKVPEDQAETLVDDLAESFSEQYD
jgi:hypothetical protein